MGKDGRCIESPHWPAVNHVVTLGHFVPPRPAARIYRTFDTVLPESNAITAGSDQAKDEVTMIAQISFDEIIGSLIACLILREVMIFTLPDRIAGPGGWLIDTAQK